MKRLGINLGTANFYDSGQTSKNLLQRNPGFEGQVWNSTIRCMSGTATSCVDEDQWSAWPAGFWSGATFEVFWGAAAGRTGTVTSSSAPGDGQGVTLEFDSYGVAPANGDYLIVRKTVPGNASGGWWPLTTGAGIIGDNLTDLPPGTLGKQTVYLSAPSNADTATLAGYFDSTAGMTFLQLNGTYQLQFKAKGTGGSNQINVQVARAGVATTYLAQPVILTNGWDTYTLTFTASENGSAVGIAGVVFATVGADSFELDDVTLTGSSGDPTNTTAFRDPVVNALRTLQPGLIRVWDSTGQLGQTLDNLLTPDFGRQPAGYSAWYTTADQMAYGLHDYLVLCQLIGSEPWFVVPSTFSTTDASNLIQYLAGASTTPYGAKRAALGQATPWTQVFSKIHLEFGNEAWNATFKGGSIEYSAPYGSRAQTIFGVMRANAAYVASSFDLVLGGQAAWPGRNTDIQNNCNNNDSFTVAPYTMGQVDSYLDNESLFGSTFAEPEAFTSSSGTAEGLTPGMLYQDYQAIQASTHPVPLSFYEINLSTLAGGISQAALNSYTPSLGAGLMVAETMLLGLRQYGVVNQQLFALPQYSFQRSDGKSVLLWGAVLDMGVTDRRRPQYLALQLANQALSNGAAMLQTVHSGADPTWNQPLVNSVQLNGAHYLQSFAFAQGQSLSAVIFNLSRSSALPITFSGVNAPTGTVQMQQLTSANPTDTNENSNVVNLSSATLTAFHPTTGLSLPPYSMTVLTWTASTQPAPVISAVSVSGVTATSATVTWTTDQPATSLVNYGTTLGYGSASSPSATLVTSHSVTLTGLTPGTSYSFDVVSANSAGTATVSGNSTFTTIYSVNASSSLPLYYVVDWGITSSEATITWSTSVPATTVVLYGLTTALGQATPPQWSFTYAHGVTLTGLTPGTKYYFVAQSTDQFGNTGYSASLQFTTVAITPPTISAITVTPMSRNTAKISWATSVPANSYIEFGLTTAYGKFSTVTGLTTAPQPSMGWVDSGVNHYRLISTDASGNRATSPDYTFVEP